jgi:hypothetical protein
MRRNWSRAGQSLVWRAVFENTPSWHFYGCASCRLIKILWPTILAGNAGGCMRVVTALFVHANALFPPANVPYNMRNISGCVHRVNHSAKNTITAGGLTLFVGHEHARWGSSHASGLVCQAAG